MGHSATEAEVSEAEQVVLAEVLRSVRGLRHGSVQIIVQDGRVVQIDTLEKKRFGTVRLRRPRMGEPRTGQVPDKEYGLHAG